MDGTFVAGKIFCHRSKPFFACVVMDGFERFELNHFNPTLKVRLGGGLEFEVYRMPLPLVVVIRGYGN